MDKEFAIEWVARLRSGLSQTTGVLHQTFQSHPEADVQNSYCCLGVACEIGFNSNRISRCKEGLLWEYGRILTQSTWDPETLVTDVPGSSYTLPEKVAELMGVGPAFGDVGNFAWDAEMVSWWKANEEYIEKCTEVDDNGEVDEDLFPLNLAGVNDRGVSFTTIADFVEKFWERL